MPKRSKLNYGSFVALTNELLDDPEWQKLSRSGMVVWINLRKQFKGDYESAISLCPSQVKGLSQASFWRGIRELKKLGWIKIISHGGFPKIPNKYRLQGKHGYFIYNGFKLK